MPFLLFLPEAINKGTLPTIIAPPIQTGTIGKVFLFSKSTPALATAVMAKTTIPPRNKNHAPVF